MKAARALLVVLVAAMTVAACSGSDSDSPSTTTTAPSPSDTLAHRLHGSNDVPGLDRPTSSEVILSFPATWRVVEGVGPEHLRLREGTPSCMYTVDADVDIVHVDATDAIDAARSVVSTGNGKLLESGRRGSAAWRVVKLRGDQTQRVRVDAARAEPLRHISTQAGQTMWLVTRVKGVSDAGDECHSGTYRDTLGPHIGDALATLRTYP